jgi:nitrate/nitrite transport system substrate-binding protein
MEAQSGATRTRRTGHVPIVSGRQWINVPIEDLPRLQGHFDYGDGRVKQQQAQMKFWADNASSRSSRTTCGSSPRTALGLPAARPTPRRWSTRSTADIWRAAAKAWASAGPAVDSRGVEKFFDGKVFDPANPAAYLASQPIKKLV